MDPINILVFGDQTADQSSFLKTVAQQKDNALLMSYLDRVGVTLRDEIRRLPRDSRDLIPNFLSVAQLIDAYYEGGHKIAQLESCFVTIAQVAHYICYYSENPADIPQPDKMRLIGVCTGSLAASAVASCTSLSDLIPLSIETIRIAFRIGTCVQSAKNTLVQSQNADQSWSTMVTSMTEKTAQSALSEFHNANDIACSNEAYISAVGNLVITISGPPSTCQRLFRESEVFNKSNRLPISVYEPYHAKHLFTQNDVEYIIDESSRHLLSQFKPRCEVHSAGTGKSHHVANSLELMEKSVTDILQESVRWDCILKECVNGVSIYGNFPCVISTFGVANVANSLLSALKSGTNKTVMIKDVTLNREPDRASGRTQNDKIAIVGMSGRFPSAANHEALWELLQHGLDVHREIPSDRFDAKAHTDASGKGKNKSHTPYGCFIDEPGLFDPRFFNMSPREAAQTDPMGRLALVTAYEALEMSGFVPNRTPSTKLDRIGTFYGQTSDDWREINAAENVDTYFITGGVRAFAPGRINYYFKFSGPSFSIDTACSSSLAAIQLACTSLWAGDCDTACAGGLNVLTNPDIFAGLSKGQFLSKTGGCKTYDNDADGYCRGDGCGTVILKRYEDAIFDNDNILGCILGAATNHSAEAVSITHPHAGAQEFLYKRILSTTGVDAHDVNYVEMHGTGTQAGDGIEMTSVTNVFAPRNRQRRQDQPLYLGAIKANIGHGEAASGINSLIKVLMMMRKNEIPPNVGIKGVMNKTFPKDLYQRNVHIETTSVPFSRNGTEKRKIFLNNFSAAGGNTALIMEDGPLRIEPPVPDARSFHLVTVTARTIASLRTNIQNLIHYLDQNPNTDLPSLSYTTTARRIQHNYRVAFTTNDISTVQNLLKDQLRGTYSPIGMVPTKTAFVFTGQGSQYAAIGKTLYDDIPSFKADIDHLDNLVRIQGFSSFMPLINSTDISTLSAAKVQTGMSCIQVALARLWASFGVRPSVVVGHSLGEYAALQIAGVISVTDMIRLVGGRAKLLEQECTAYSHGMLAAKASVKTLKDALRDQMLEIACVNGPEDTVLSGTVSVIDDTISALTSKGIKATKLNVPYAFHSSQVDPIMESFKVLASNITYNRPTVPILSPLTGGVIVDAGIIGPEYLVRHARETVLFTDVISYGLDNKIYDQKTAWIEIGSHPVCLSMIRASLVDPHVAAPSLRRNEDCWKTLTNSIVSLYLAGVFIDFNDYHREFVDAHQLLELPTYSFDNKRYWLDYHNNWTLTKGETQCNSAATESFVERPSFSTTSCQRIVREEIGKTKGLVVFQSDLTEPKLYAAVTGHLCNDAALCPSSLYADMCMTVADYLYKQLKPGSSSVGYNVCKMEVPKPLIAKIPAQVDGQHIQIQGIADIESGLVNIKLTSVTPDGKLMQEHAFAVVKYENIDDWKQEWNRTQFMVQTQVDFLRQKLKTGQAHKLLRGMAYKLFKALVNYSEPYRGMEEVILDGKQTEGTASVKFQTTEKDGNFMCSPFWIDSLCHLSGFIVNASDIVDSANSVYISHGWGSIRISTALSPEKSYTSYVRMLPAPNKVSVGDVYILDGDEVIGMVTGLKFQEIPRRVLDVMLPPINKANVSQQSAIAKSPVPAKPVQKVTPRKLLNVPSRKPPVSNTVKPPRMVVTSPSSNTVTSRVMKIIAEETDVDMSELVDDAAFENLGVDSLMSLTISARFREVLNLEISSTLFSDNPTVGQMRKFFAQYDGGAPLFESEDSDVSEGSGSNTPYEHYSASTPPSSAPSSAASECGDDDLKMDSDKNMKGLETSMEVSIARQVVAQEMGVHVSEITDKADLSEMGMDSLMSLSVLGVLREKTGIDIPSTFLATNVTIEDIENELGMRPKARTIPQAMNKSKAVSLNAVNGKLKSIAQDVSKYPKAKSVLLQGNSKIASQKVFLFPDGSGSATSYTSIPNISPDVAVFGMNSPFIKSPADFSCGISGMATIFLNEMKRRQPNGPYIVGGWSAGGCVAYEVACQLLEMGEEVKRLILLDSPCPVNLEPLPPRAHQFFDSIGLLGTGKPGGTPAWLLQHFEYTIKALEAYKPLPMPAGQAPSVHAIWATDGLCGKPGDPRPPPCDEKDPKPMTWLLENRTDFGDNGWAQLLPESKFRFVTMSANHFTMMRPEQGETLGRLIKEGLDIL